MTVVESFIGTIKVESFFPEGNPSLHIYKLLLFLF